MHRFPCRAALDVELFEVLAYPVTIGTKGGRFDGDTGQPVVRFAVHVYGHEVDAIDSFEVFAVAAMDRATTLDLFVQILQLPPADRGEKIAQPVVVADVTVLVVRRGIARLSGEMSCTSDKRLVVSNQRASTTASDDLVAVEREHADRSEATGRAIVIRRPDRLCSVLDEGNIVGVTDAGETVVVSTLSVEVDGDDSGGQAT